MIVGALVTCGIFVCASFPVREAFLVVPEDLGTGFATVYGFSPRLVIGRDHRLGFGFRFGNHADLQLLYELGPQTATAALATTTNTTTTIAATTGRSRRRPFALVELLLRAGLRAVHSERTQR